MYVKWYTVMDDLQQARKKCMTTRFPDTTFLDEYDYRIWHKSDGITFYEDVSTCNFTTACSFLWLLQYYDRARGVEYANQGLQVAPTGTDDWFEFTFNDGTTIKHQMGTVYTQRTLL